MTMDTDSELGGLAYHSWYRNRPFLSDSYTPYSSTFTECRWNIGGISTSGDGVSARTELNSMNLNVALCLPPPS